MFFVATFNKEFTPTYHAASMMNAFILQCYDYSDLDISDDIKYDCIEDLDEIVKEYDYGRFRRLMQKYGITAKHIISFEKLDRYQGAGFATMSYNSTKQLKSIYVNNLKSYLKGLDKGTDKYKEAMKLYGKLKLVDDPESIFEAEQLFCTRTGQEYYTKKVFYDFEDYLQYIFDNQ